MQRVRKKLLRLGSRRYGKELMKVMGYKVKKQGREKTREEGE